MDQKYHVFVTIGFFIATVVSIEARHAMYVDSNALAIAKRSENGEACTIGGDDFSPKAVSSTEDATKVSNDRVTNSLSSSLSWQELLTPAPLVLCLLGQIMVLGSQQDFKLTTNTTRKFDHIKYLDSFRATLAQVGNEGLTAFREADKNMREMSNHLKAIPTKVREAINFLNTAPPKLKGKLMKTPLDRIETMTNQCVELADKTKKKFESVQLLLQEVLEVSQMKRGEQEQHEKEVEGELKAMHIQKDLYKKLEEEANATREAAQQSVAASEEKYKKAVEKIPTGWELLGQEVIKTVAQGVVQLGTAAVQMLAPMAMGPAGAGMMAAKSVGTAVNVAATSGAQEAAMKKQMNEQLDNAVLMAISNQFEQLSKVIKAFLKKLNDDLKGVSLSTGAMNATNLKAGTERIAQMIEASLEVIQQAKIINTGADSKTSATDLVQKVIDHLKPVQELADDADAQKTTQECVNELGQLLPSIQALATQLARVAAGPEGQPGAGAAPLAPKANMSPEQQAAELELQKLEMEKTRFQKAKEEQKQIMISLAKITGDIAKMDMTKLELGQIIEILKKALNYLENLKEQWTKLVRFFSTLATQTRSVLSGDVKDFLNHMETAKDATEDPGSLKYFKTMFKCKEFIILKTSNYLFTMSSTYVAISEKFLMPRITGMTSLLNAETASQRENLVSTLLKHSEIAQKEISHIADEQNKAYLAHIQKHKEEMEEEKKAVEGKRKCKGFRFYLGL